MNVRASRGSKKPRRGVRVKSASSKPDGERIVIIIKDSSGAMIRMRGTTRDREQLVKDRFARDHNGDVSGFTFETKAIKTAKGK